MLVTASLLSALSNLISVTPMVCSELVYAGAAMLAMDLLSQSRNVWSSNPAPVSCVFELMQKHAEVKLLRPMTLNYGKMLPLNI